MDFAPAFHDENASSLVHSTPAGKSMAGLGRTALMSSARKALGNAGGLLPSSALKQGAPAPTRRAFGDLTNAAGARGAGLEAGETAKKEAPPTARDAFAAPVAALTAPPPSVTERSVVEPMERWAGRAGGALEDDLVAAVESEINARVARAVAYRPPVGPYTGGPHASAAMVAAMATGGSPRRVTRPETPPRLRDDDGGGLPPLGDAAADDSWAAVGAADDLLPPLGEGADSGWLIGLGGDGRDGAV